MPIVDIEIVLQPAESVPRGLAKVLADSIGQVFESDAGNTWIKLHLVPDQHYAENNRTFPSDIHPIFVSVLKGTADSREFRQLEAHQLAAVIAKICGRPQDNVHIIYQPAAIGRIAFGGRLATDD